MMAKRKPKVTETKDDRETMSFKDFKQVPPYFLVHGTCGVCDGAGRVKNPLSDVANYSEEILEESLGIKGLANKKLPTHITCGKCAGLGVLKARLSLLDVIDLVKYWEAQLDEK